MAERMENNKSLAALVHETIKETQSKNYDRDQLREIADRISQRYVTSIQSDESSKPA